MALRNGRPILIYGTMGGDGQPQTQSAVLTRVLDYQMDVTAALGAPRWLYGRTWGSQQEAVFLEQRFSSDVLEELRRRDHDVTVVSAYDDKLGHAQAIAVNPTTRAFAAAIFGVTEAPSAGRTIHAWPKIPFMDPGRHFGTPPILVEWQRSHLRASSCSVGG
jgi:gamma-glutamyltranspeptidase